MALSQDPVIRDHQAWLGYVRPDSDGLVVSAVALSEAQAVINRNDINLQQRFLPYVEDAEMEDGLVQKFIGDIPAFLQEFLEWPADCLVGLDAESSIPDELKFDLKEYGEVLAPGFAFRLPKPADPAKPWLLLGLMLPRGTDLDAAQTGDAAGWAASHTQRFERLLRETKVSIGLLFSGTRIRLLYAPHGESAGYVTFPVSAMTEVSGRPILGALHLLLDRYRLLAAPTPARLPALLAKSREYQNTVSTKLAGQVLDALYELLRGLQAADERTGGDLLRQVLRDKPNSIYEGLLTVLMRLVFLLYAEDRGVMPSTQLYNQNYSVHDLYERLRADAEHYPDTMDSRYGAWARSLAVFRAVHDGCRHPQLKMPARHGHLFDPERFRFLEGRSGYDHPVPLISDGVLHRVLQGLLVLDGERLSYRTLDVEQIGSVYETMMGFRLEIASGPAIAIKPAKKMGAPAVVDLSDLLQIKAADRGKQLQEITGQKFTGAVADSIKSATTTDDLLAALERKIARNATPHPVTAGTMVLQPTDERRRSGSHYTPRSLTEPIVRKTLEPILERLGSDAAPGQVLDLKVCDIAMGSGAFLVEACRQLADVLVRAWHVHSQVPKIPPDETEHLYAMRIVAQRCLYGVDRNPMAVDLAKLSLWLATLAKDHPFTFLDHTFRCGDSLVGLTRDQIVNFTWGSDDTGELTFWQQIVESKMNRAMAFRREILEAGDFMPTALKRQKLDQADEALEQARFVGDLAIAAFFSAPNDRRREERRLELRGEVLTFVDPGKIDMALLQRLQQVRKQLRFGENSIYPFHWEIEFPEVFGRESSGFDSIVGNPPFLGGLRVSNMLGMTMFSYLTEQFEGAGHMCDLVAYFFRRAFALIRRNGTLGLIATNSIAEGDTRTGGLAWICKHGGTILNARRRMKWPGEAAVTVSVIQVLKGVFSGTRFLDGSPVERITAYLFSKGGSDDPIRFARLNALFSQGTNIRSGGFLIGPGEATEDKALDQLLQHSPKSATRVFPYLGGEEINNDPAQRPVRRVIFLSDLREESELAGWPELSSIVREKVKPERDALGSNPNNVPLKRRWWAYHADRRDFYSQIRTHGRVLVMSQVSAHLAFVLQPADQIYGNTTNLFLITSYAGFAAMQCRVHEVWVRFFASRLEDRLRYTPSDCFETFPFPEHFELHPDLEEAGRGYYTFRADLMVRNNEGLTKTYNRFHDPQERSPDILRLRELHDTMDRAVLDAYGWTDISTDCEFLLDYEEDEEEEVTTRRRRKPYRYRWPDDSRDEVLARLLALNAKRAEEELLQGGSSTDATAKNKAARQRKASKTKAVAATATGFLDPDEE